MQTQSIASLIYLIRLVGTERYIKLDEQPAGCQFTELRDAHVFHERQAAEFVRSAIQKSPGLNPGDQLEVVPAMREIKTTVQEPTPPPREVVGDFLLKSPTGGNGMHYVRYDRRTFTALHEEQQHATRYPTYEDANRDRVAGLASASFTREFGELEIVSIRDLEV